MHSSSTKQDIGFPSLVALLRHRSHELPEQQSMAFLDDERDEVSRLTYSALDRRARAIAALLHSQGQRGERALMLYPPGLDFVSAFFGCLYAGTIAVPAYPPRPRTLARLQSIIDDARPQIILSTCDVRDLVEPMLSEVPDLAHLRWVTTEDLPDGWSHEWQDPGVDVDSLAFLQYTSGSTSTPRGVMVSHGNLLLNSQMIRDGFDTHRGSSGVIWLPLYHDMGLIGGILQPIFAALPVTLMSPLTFLQRPFRWLQAISSTGATISGGPNFAYDLCVRKITAEQRASLDLSGWEVAFSGAEPVRAETIDRFTEAFAPQGFRREAWYPCYGLAEATLFVSGAVKARGPRFLAVSAHDLEQRRVVPALPGQESTRTLVSCGRVADGLQIAIVDPESHSPCTPGSVGEIWLSGPSVARGYWNRSEDNERIFRACLDGSGAWLRTGDLGFLDDGELFIAGRIKDLIIIDGRNHYPQDIELTVESSHAALRPDASAAFSIEADGEERLVVVAELEREHMPGRPGAVELSTLMAAVRRAVTEQHAVQIHDLVLIKTGHIPKTTSGKIQRHACRLQYLEGTLARVARRGS